jgi:hypothetical protein
MNAQISAECSALDFYALAALPVSIWPPTSARVSPGALVAPVADDRGGSAKTAPYLRRVEKSVVPGFLFYFFLRTPMGVV